MEYSYIIDGENGMIFKNIDDAVGRFDELTENALEDMLLNAKKTAEKSFPKNMAKRAVSIFKLNKNESISFR